jgi:hypothetical protein
MPFISTPQAVEAKLIMSQNSVPLVNIWNFDVGHAVTLTDLTGVFAVVDAFVTAELRNLMHVSVSYDQIIVTDISVPNGQQIINTPTSPNGLNTGVAAGANVAFVASLRSAQTGRNFRGRSYMAGLTASVLADAQHTSTVYAAAVNTSFVNFINAAVTAGYKLCVLSRYLNRALRTVGLLTEIISVITDTKIDSQRRRTAN